MLAIGGLDNIWQGQRWLCVSSQWLLNETSSATLYLLTMDAGASGGNAISMTSNSGDLILALGMPAFLFTIDEIASYITLQTFAL